MRTASTVTSAHDWRWRTFPVLAAFVFGALVASFIDQPDSNFAVVVRVMLVLAAAYCVIHIAVVYFMLPRREGDDADLDAGYEDELVLDPGDDS
jgi:hypothetical protein